MSRMVMTLTPLLAGLITATPSPSHAQQPREKVVIAHRGASGYLPEHTLSGAAMAHAWGVDYIEPDIVLSRDGKAVVLHDIHLETTTNAAEVFPDRARADGRHYAIDFDLAELKRLRVGERRDPKTGAAAFSKRFPLGKGRFEIPTLVELLELIAGLNHSTERRVGVYPEIKNPTFHRKAGHDLARTTLAILRRAGYAKRSDPVILQCFDGRELRRIRGELSSQLRLVQLIGDDAWGESGEDYQAMRSSEGLEKVRAYADGVGLWIGHCLRSDGGSPADTGLVARARAAGLRVHLYTARADKLPAGVTFDQLLELLLFELGADGVFTDHADRALRFLERRRRPSEERR
jgi:glycerophosphoryl diester phosphodiesterase